MQRSFDGWHWVTRTGADDRKEAEILADRCAAHAERGVHFRVIDSANGTELFTVENT